MLLPNRVDPIFFEAHPYPCPYPCRKCLQANIPNCQKFSRSSLQVTELTTPYTLLCGCSLRIFLSVPIPYTPNGLLIGCTVWS